MLALAHALAVMRMAFGLVENGEYFVDDLVHVFPNSLALAVDSRNNTANNVTIRRDSR
jgi:hypothetical protein